MSRQTRTEAGTTMSTVRTVWSGFAIKSTVVGLILLSTVGVACKGDEEQAKPDIPRMVRVERVGQTEGETTRTFSGISKAGTESRLSFKVAGTVAKLNVKVGDKVKKGFVIATMEGADLSLQVQEAKASFEQTKAQERNLKAQYERVKALYEANNASKQELDAARSASDSARASVSAAEKRVQLAQTRAGYTALTAPVEGTIAKVSCEANENVGAGQTVAVLNSGLKAEVEIAVPELLIGRVEQGGKAVVRFDAIKGTDFKASVTEVGIAPESTGTTFPVLVRLTQGDKRIRAGMAAEVTLQFGKAGKSAALLVRPNAVGEDRKGRFAYVAVPSDPGFAQVKRREVKVGNIKAEGLEVREGLKEGELLVTAGLTYLKDGMRVRLPKGLDAKPEGSGKPSPKASASSPVPANSKPVKK